MLTLTDTLKTQAISPEYQVQLTRLKLCSPFSMRLFLKDADNRADLLANLHQPYTLLDMQNFLQQTQIIDENALKKTLRQLRQRVMLRIVTRDLNGLADLNEVMQTTSDLADIVLNTAIFHHQTWLEASYGSPVNENGTPQSLIVVGMGKLGGFELNVSSDIDLIFCYAENGETDGEKAISNQDFFTKLSKKLISAIDDMTEDGFVFRVDMRLRPFGSEGAIVSSIDALEDYYQNNGREWERYAWIKGRIITNNGAVLEQLLKPFVFRKYLDFGTFASMRDLKTQIHRDVIQRGLADNIKLGRGGIREIEFIAQVFQLIRGGTDASLQIKPTLAILKLLQNKGLLPEKTVAELTQAYIFLRNLEHRLMYVEDQQTQDLPKSDEAKVRIANAMNYEDWASFKVVLENHRGLVASHFDAVFNEGVSGEKASNTSVTTFEFKSLWQGLLSQDIALIGLEDAGFSEPQVSLQRLVDLRKSARYLQLPELSRLRFDTLMPKVILQSSRQENSNETLLRVCEILTSICRRASYLALLSEYPNALELVVKLSAASPWLANYLAQHPILLDELLDTNSLYSPPDFGLMRENLLKMLSDCKNDIEQQMDRMRHFKHAATFRFAAQDIAGVLPLTVLSDYLSALADLILSVSLQVIWTGLQVKHQAVPQFAVIGYGKLGSTEMGYGSDLDIIFLYDDANENASEIYAKFAQKINNWLGSLTPAGLLYEVDLALRPNGASGLLVSSVSAFREYQLKQAWVWEHQALTRARFVAGDASIGQAFEQIRIDVIQQSRDSQTLKTEIIQMREKMRSALKITHDVSVVKMFDLKQSKGGLIDIEFMVQFLVLNYANQYPQLIANIGNIALLKTSGVLGLIDKKLSEQVACAYQHYRQLQHSIRLQGKLQAQLAAALVQPEITRVESLWQALFTK